MVTGFLQLKTGYCWFLGWVESCLRWKPSEEVLLTNWKRCASPHAWGVWHWLGCPSHLSDSGPNSRKVEKVGTSRVRSHLPLHDFVLHLMECSCERERGTSKQAKQRNDHYKFGNFSSLPRERGEREREREFAVLWRDVKFLCFVLIVFVLLFTTPWKKKKSETESHQPKVLLV